MRNHPRNKRYPVTERQKALLDARYLCMLAEDAGGLGVYRVWDYLTAEYDRETGK